MDGRRQAPRPHQAIEAKENAKIESATKFCHYNFTELFRMYNKLSEMTGQLLLNR